MSLLLWLGETVMALVWWLGDCGGGAVGTRACVLTPRDHGSTLELGGLDA